MRFIEPSRDGMVRVSKEQFDALWPRIRQLTSSLSQETINRIIKRDEDAVFVHRGMAERVHIPFELVEPWEEPGFPSFRGRLFPFQEKAVSELARRESGYLEAPTGSGKTIIGIALASRLRVKTLFLVPTKNIAEQTWKACKKFLGIKADCNWGRKKRAESAITIATFQKILYQGYISDDYGCIILDEVAHVPAQKFIQVLEWAEAKYRFGLTATLHRRDEFGKCFRFLLSSFVYKISLEDARNVLALPTVFFLKTNVSSSEADFCLEKCKFRQRCKINPKECGYLRKTFFQVFVAEILASRQRDTLITKTVERLRNIGKKKILLLTSRVGHVKALSQKIKDAGIDNSIAHGRARESAKNIEDFRHSTIGVLVATEQLLGEGTDFPECDALILCAPAGGKVKTKQRVGRVMRKGASGSKSPLVVDLFDGGFGQVLFFARKRQYEAMRFRIRVVGDPAQIEG